MGGSSGIEAFYRRVHLFAGGGHRAACPWTNMPLAISIFVISLGLIEKDGKMITLGILIGLASLALVGGLIFGALSLFGLL